jgi:hypothetical protein
MKNNWITLRSVFTTLVLGTALLAFPGCEKNNTIGPGNPVADAKPIRPDSAGGGTVLTLFGTGLGDMRTIVFEKGNVPAALNPTFNTETNIVFRVPDTAFGGLQNIVFTNSAGRTLSVPFKVIALPTITTAFPTDFKTGSQITFTGNNLDDVTSVTLEGTTDAATIVRKSRKELVIAMPATNVARAKLRIRNGSGETLTNAEFVSIANSFAYFDDAFGPTIVNYSWNDGNNYAPSTEQKITGTHGLRAGFDGSWTALSMHSDAGIPIAGYSFIAFWIKGADVEKKLRLKINWATDLQITVPANVWTYYRQPFQGFIPPGTTKFNDFVFQIEDAGKPLFFDNILLVK